MNSQEESKEERQKREIQQKYREIRMLEKENNEVGQQLFRSTGA